MPKKFAKVWGAEEAPGQLRGYLDLAIKGMESKLEVKSEEAKKILMEASAVAEQRKKFRQRFSGIRQSRLIAIKP